MRQRKPQHGADAERDERRFEPELRAESPGARRKQQPRRGQRDAWEEGKLQQTRSRLHRRVVERPRGRNGERRSELDSQREREPAPGVAPLGLELGQARGTPGSEHRGNSYGDAGEERDELLVGSGHDIGRDRREAVSTTQSSTTQAAAWSYHGARVSRSPLTDGWFRSSSIKPLSSSRAPGTVSPETRKIGSMVT